MSALRLRSSTRNAAKSELIEEKLVHLRCKFIARGTRIVVISMAVNTQGVRFQKSLKLFCKPLRKEEQSGLFTSSFSQVWKFKGQSSSGGKSTRAVPGHDRTEDLDNH